MVSTSLYKTQAELKKESIRRSRIEARAFYEKRLEAIPKRYQSARLHHINSQLKIKLLSGGCYLWGGTGVGKTYAMYALARYLSCKKNSFVKFITFEQLLRKIRDGFSTKTAEGDILDGYENAEYLFLDDIGASSDSGFASRILLSLLDYRYNNNLRTYISSNLTAEKVKETFGERTFSRILGMCEVIKLGGKDKRIKI